MAEGLEVLFSFEPPLIAKDKQFTTEERRDRIRKLWPAGHAAGTTRMDSFIDHIHDYAATRSRPAAGSTSRMSAYFSTDIVSIRKALS